MNACMRSCWTAAAAVVLLSMIQPAVIRAADTEAQMPWEKVGANVGVFLAGLDSSIRIGSGIGVVHHAHRFRHSGERTGRR
jgi:hypothetical protein